MAGVLFIVFFCWVYFGLFLVFFCICIACFLLFLLWFACVTSMKSWNGQLMVCVGWGGGGGGTGDLWVTLESRRLSCCTDETIVFVPPRECEKQKQKRESKKSVGRRPSLLATVRSRRMEKRERQRKRDSECEGEGGSAWGGAQGMKSGNTAVRDLFFIPHTAHTRTQSAQRGGGRRLCGYFEETNRTRALGRHLCGAKEGILSLSLSLSQSHSPFFFLLLLLHVI